MSRLRIWVAGPAGWENPVPLEAALRKLVAHYGIARLVIMSDGQPGVGRMIAEQAVGLGVVPFVAKAPWAAWNHHAGSHRNDVIACEFRPHVLVAFRYFKLASHLEVLQAVRTAREYDIPVKMVRVRPEVALPSTVSDCAPGAKARARRAAEAERAKRAVRPTKTPRKPVRDA